MKCIDVRGMTVEQLVERLAAIGLEQDYAGRTDDNAKFGRLFWQMEAIEDELKVRMSDQRRALLELFHHANVQVRLAAAKATLAVAPEDARRMLEVIANSRQYAQAGDAGMCLDALDDGIFKPT